jgi:biopolymer transport protein ExbB/TolQ
MSLVQLLIDFASLGTEWVVWLLVALSIISSQIMLDRAYFFWRRRINVDRLAKQLIQLLRRG